MSTPQEARKSTPPGRLACWTMLAVLLAMIAQLQQQGRIWWCACGRPSLWAGDIWSAHNSQHLLDPYSFTHVLHGVLFCGILALLAPRWSRRTRLGVGVALAAAWEVLENSPMIIHRYREATIGIGYEGDSIVNSLADVACCVLGFLLAARLGWRWSIALFVAVEVLLLVWVRDNLTLNILMLIHPVESIKAWQMVHPG